GLGAGGRRGLSGGGGTCSVFLPRGPSCSESMSATDTFCRRAGLEFRLQAVRSDRLKAELQPGPAAKQSSYYSIQSFKPRVKQLGSRSAHGPFRPPTSKGRRSSFSPGGGGSSRE